MATGEQRRFPLPFKLVEFTDCHRCEDLCLGPMILPCGHVVCRKCLRELLRVAPSRCPQCKRAIRQTNQRTKRIVEMLQHLDPDPTLELMVFKRLRERGDIHCQKCPENSTHAVKVCLDCREYYCEACASTHTKSKRGKEHVVKEIPPENALALALAPRGPSSTSVCVECGQPGSAPNPCEHGPTSQVNRNLPESTKREVRLVQEKRRENEELIATLSMISSLAGQLIDRTKQQKDVLGDYIQRLDSSEVKEGSTPGSYVVAMDRSESEGGGRREMTIDELEAHMTEVRARNRCPSMETLRRVFRGGEQEN